MAAGSGFRVEGRHVLAAMLLFFSSVFAVNGYFIARAVATHTGEVAVEPYRKGLQYNGRIAADEAQRALGWRSSLDVGADGRGHFTLTDADNRPVTGLSVRLGLGRPATERFDRRLVLEETAPGRYAIAAGPIEAGTWIASIEAQPAREPASMPVFRERRRLWFRQ